MPNAAQAQQPAAAKNRSTVPLPGENLTLEETLRVMDVAREIRSRRETAEEMFRHDEVRRALRDKLLNVARISGDKVTEAELDAAIDHYLSNLNTYQDPDPGLKTSLAYLWVWRERIVWSAATLAVIAGGFWYFLT